MSVRIRVELDRAAIRRVTGSMDGPVGRAVREVTERTARKTRQRAPVDTGELRASVTTEYEARTTRITGTVWVNARHSRPVQLGTGIYGPSGRPIRPRRAQVLAFPSRGGGGMVFARQVRGQRPQPFQVQALRDASPWPVVEL